MNHKNPNTMGKESNMDKKSTYSTDPAVIRMFMDDYNRKKRACESLATTIFSIFPDPSQWTEDIAGLHYDLDSIVPTYELNGDTIEMEGAKVFDCDNDGLELQAYNRRSYSSGYWWTNPNISPEEYMEDRINVIRKILKERSSVWYNAITNLETNLNLAHGIGTAIASLH